MQIAVTSHIDLFLVLLSVGAVGGFLSGMLGVGGGIVFVPALYFTLQSFFPGSFHVMHVAVATSLSLVMATSASSAYWQNKRGAVDFELLKTWAFPKICGVLLGTFLASYVNSGFLKDFFAVITVLIGTYIVLGKDAAEDAPPRPHRISKGMQKVLAAMIGTVASMLGIGGATLNIPLMNYIGLPIRKSVGTGGALAVIISLPGVIGYILIGLYKAPVLPPYCLGYVNWLALACILPTSMLLSPVGVHVSHKMPRKVLRGIFAAVLLAVSVRMISS